MLTKEADVKIMRRITDNERTIADLDEGLAESAGETSTERVCECTSVDDEGHVQTTGR